MYKFLHDDTSNIIVLFSISRYTVCIQNSLTMNTIAVITCIAIIFFGEYMVRWTIDPVVRALWYTVQDACLPWEEHQHFHDLVKVAMLVSTKRTK